MNNSQLITYEGKDYGVSLDWQEFIGKKNFVRNKIKDTLRKQKYDGFGVKNEDSKNVTQIGFSDKSFKGVPSLAKFLCDKDEFKNSLVILKIDNEQFWVCGITYKGLIEIGSDMIYDRDDFISAISSYFAILEGSANENFKIMISDSDFDYINSLVEDEISEFNIEKFDSHVLISGNSKSAEVELVYNATVDLAKQISTFALAGVSLVSCYFFLYLEDPVYDQIVTQELSEGVYNSKNSYEKFVSDQEKKLSNSFETVAKKEILKRRNTAYSNEEIYNYIETLSLAFPLYLVEWEIDSINYNNAKREFFEISYKRIPNSYGNTEELKVNLDSILSKNNIKDYQFINKNNKGDNLAVSISFKNKIEIDLAANANINDINKKIKKLEGEILNLTTNIESLENEVLNFSFFDKRFGNALSEKETEILDMVDATSKAYKDMKKERTRLEINDVEIDPKIISGTKIDVLSMVQSYSYYKWTDVNIINYFPEIKNNSRVKGEEVKVFAQSNSIEVGDGGNLDILGLKGLKNVLNSNNLLNKVYIQINNVNLNIQTEEWSIKGEYYEKI